jgi:hypothetical protein
MMLTTWAKSVLVSSFVSVLAPSAAFAVAVVVIGNNYQRTATKADCGSTNPCIVSLGKAPAGKDLVINRLSCLVTGSPRGLYLETLPSGVRSYVRPARSDSTSSTSYANGDVTHLVLAGQSLQVSAEGFPVTSLSCTISGTLVAR